QSPSWARDGLLSGPEWVLAKRYLQPSANVDVGSETHVPSGVEFANGRGSSLRNRSRRTPGGSLDNASSSRGRPQRRIDSRARSLGWRTFLPIGWRPFRVREDQAGWRH